MGDIAETSMHSPILSPGKLVRAIAFAMLVIGLLAGCATLNPQDQQVLRQHHVPSPLQEKMVSREVLTLPEIVALSKLRVPPDYLIRYIDASLGEYQMTTKDVLDLRSSQVNEKVIDYLLTTAPREMMVVDRPYWPYYPRTLIIRHDHRHHRRR
jgi:hypothetical protein